MRHLWVFVVSVAVIMAGCAGTKNEISAAQAEDFEELSLEATATTGVLRGVVVDEAIRPIAGAVVAIQGDAGSSITTTDTGVFGFDDLEAGTYFLEVSKIGYFSVQQSTEVVAGEAEPSAVKILLRKDAASTPFVQVQSYEGYIECTTSVIVACGIANLLTGENHTNDRFAWDQSFADDAMHLQAELVWDSTQSLSPELYFEMEALNDGCDGGDDDERFLNSTRGSSPIYATVNASQIDLWDIGSACPLWISLFSGGVSGAPCGDADPTGNAPGWCAGATVSQRFSMYFHTFHGFLPPAGWRFTTDGTTPAPPS